MRIRCRPQQGFPVEFQHPPRHDLFKAGWSSTMSLLGRELDQIDANEVVIELALDEADIRLDGWPRAGARTSHPGVVLSFDSRHGPLRYGTNAFPSWQSNVRAIALGLKALRKVERYGIGKRGEQYTGWRELPSGDRMDEAEARELLDGYGGEKAAIRLSHPDADSGSPEAFQRVQTAREVLGLR